MVQLLMNSGAPLRQAAGRQAVLFLKKKNQKNFCPLGARRCPLPSHHIRLAANTLSGLKLPSLAANRSQTDKSFLLLFFKKEDACLPATCLPAPCLPLAVR
jgi:hypothetical protein